MIRIVARARLVTKLDYLTSAAYNLEQYFTFISSLHYTMYRLNLIIDTQIHLINQTVWFLSSFFCGVVNFLKVMVDPPCDADL